MKKVLTLIFAFSLFMLLTIASSAEEASTEYYYHEGDCEIYIQRSTLSDEQLELIAQRIAGIDSSSTQTARGLTCTLFGHDYEYTTVTKITHKYYSSAPRCLEETYRVGICSRCDDSTQTLEASIRLYCCPVD
mgnify:CR=1 FL=1